MNQKAILCLLCVGMIGAANGAPYYYFFTDPQAAVEQAKQTVQQETSEQADQQAQQVAAEQQIQEAVSKAGQKVTSAAHPNGAELRERLHGHLSDLYSHGSSAMKSVVDNVQPDIKNIGRDVGEAISQTGSRVAQTVRPFIDQANKVVSPYVSQAREEVPKLLEQAKPVLNKMGEQVRSGIGGVLNKIQQNGQQQAPEAGQVVTDVLQQAHDGANNIKHQVDSKAQSS